jgi:hypothetical protein
MSEINIEKLRGLGSKWKVLNDQYDNMIIELIDASQPVLISVEKLEEMRKIQDEIFDLEIELYDILQGK